MMAYVFTTQEKLDNDVSSYGCMGADFTGCTTNEDKINVINQEIIKSQNTVKFGWGAKERIAAMLEYQVLSDLPDIM